MTEENIRSSTASNANTNAMLEAQARLKRNSNDVGWEYGVLYDPNNFDKLKCKLCGKEMSGGVHRMKQHIAQIRGNVSSCPTATSEDIRICKVAFEEFKKKKKDKRVREEEVRQEVVIGDEDIEEQEEEIRMSGSLKKRANLLGPMDKFASQIKVGASMDSNSMRQQNISDALFKERTNDVHKYLAKWVYEAGIPFHAIENDSFKRFCEAVGQFGPKYRPPSQYQLREPLLCKEVARTKESLKKQEEEWALSGCSIMTDAWTDRKRRSIMNLCVNCKEGTSFLDSKEDSATSHTGEYIFQYVDKYIEQVGPQNVIQVVTDNASNNMAAADLLATKRPTIFWTSCATHTLNLMLEGIGKQPRFKGVIEKAKSFTFFIYAHHKTLAMMRQVTNKKDIVRPGVTRFATSFLTLQSLMAKKDKLRAMFTSTEWEKLNISKSKKGKVAYSTIMSLAFWNGIALCLKVFAPLVKVLRLVDGDRKPAMGFLYGELLQAKEEIKEVLKHNETHYRPILDIIDAKAKDRLDQPLHLAAYLLNPYYHFNNPNIQDDHIVMDGLLACVDKFFKNDDRMQHVIVNVELLKYKRKEGMFGRTIAAVGCAKNNDNYDPVGWWSNYGSGTPNLQKMAKRILALTTSSSGCERNWSVFEAVHTKKRNRLDAARLGQLVYVQFNAKLFEKKRREKERGADVLLANEASRAQGWIVDGGDEEDVEVEPGTGLTWRLVSDASGADTAFAPRRSARNVEVRELHEQDFESDEETDDEVDEQEYEFESDGELVLEKYGEEEPEMDVA